jgi:uncharacterized protein (TIGR02284 family)
VSSTAESTSAGLEDVVSRLNQLIHTCKDGENGFRTAALAAHDQELRRLFESYSQQRAEMAAELQLEIRRLARDPVDSGHTAAALHRAWMDIVAGVTGRDDSTLIGEAQRGEQTALAAYQKALEENLPAALRAVIERQLLDVQRAHNHLQSLDRALNPSS